MSFCAIPKCTECDERWKNSQPVGWIDAGSVTPAERCGGCGMLYPAARQNPAAIWNNIPLSIKIHGDSFRPVE